MKKNERTLQTYNGIAREYAALNNGNETMKHYHIVFDTLLKDGDTIYDVGCGTGRDVAVFTKWGYNVIGMDASEGMLQVAREMYPNCRFEHRNILTDTESLEEVNGIWACASLLHFTEQEFREVFQTLAKKLKEGGIFYLSLKLKDKMYGEEIDGRYFQYFTEEYLLERFEKEGLLLLHSEQNQRGQDVFGSYFLQYPRKLNYHSCFIEAE